MRVSSFKFRLVVLGGIVLATVLVSGCATIDLYPGNVIDEGTVGRTEEPQTYLELQLGQVAQSDSLAVRVSEVELVMDYSYPDPAGPGHYRRLPAGKVFSCWSMLSSPIPERVAG